GRPPLPVAGVSVTSSPLSRCGRARSSAGEHYVDIVGVTGSIPVAPTTPNARLGDTAGPRGYTMRLAVTAVLAVALPALLGACAPAPIDPEQATERAATGAGLGAALGSGIGATGAINAG